MRSSTLSVFVLLLVISPLLSGCGSSEALVRQDRAPARVGSSSDLSDSRAPWQRKIVKRASLTLETDDPEGALRELTTHAEALGGFVLNASETNETRAEATLRIPAGLFDKSLKRIEKVGRVIHRELGGQDVTDHYYDLQGRIENAEKIKARLARLLEKAHSVDDALKIERELGRVQGELESMKARLERLKDSITYATIRVVLKKEQEGFPGPVTLAAQGSWWLIKKLFWID